MKTSAAMESGLKYFVSRYIMLIFVLMLCAGICTPNSLSASEGSRRNNSDAFLDITPELERFYAAVYNYREIGVIEDTHAEAVSAIQHGIDDAYLRALFQALRDLRFSALFACG